MFVLSGGMFLLDRQRELGTGYAPLASSDFNLIRVYEGATVVQPPVIVENTAVFVGTRSSDQLSALTAIDIPTGRLLWHLDVSEQSEPGWWVDDLEWNYPLSWQWGPMATDGEAVFFADRFLLTTSLTAVSLETGERLWQRQIGTVNGSRVRHLNVINDLVAARIIESSYSDLFVVDPSNGFLVFRENEGAVGLYWREEIGEQERGYRAYDFGMETTNVNPWQMRFESCGMTPQLLPDRIIVHALMCDASGRGAILALDRQSGVTLWRLAVPVVSQMAIDGEIGYVMSEDNQLLAVDLGEGAIVSILRFDKPIRNLTPETPIFVGSGDGKTAVYFGMSKQLMFFQSKLGER